VAQIVPGFNGTGHGQLRFLNRWLSLPVSMISHPVLHSPNDRFVVTISEMRSYPVRREEDGADGYGDQASAAGTSE
jgi:hypothetical protein